MSLFVRYGGKESMNKCKSVGVRTFDSFKWVLLIMMISLFSFFSFGCGKQVETETTVPPSSPEECITAENQVFSYYEAVVGTQGGDESVSYRLYKYTDSELVLVRNDSDTDDKVTTNYRIVPSSVLDDCLKLAKKYKMGKGKWIDGDGIVGGELSISFVKDGEVISVSSSHMPDNGMEAFHAVRKVLGEAWSQGK